MWQKKRTVPISRESRHKNEANQIKGKHRSRELNSISLVSNKIWFWLDPVFLLFVLWTCMQTCDTFMRLLHLCQGLTKALIFVLYFDPTILNHSPFFVSPVSVHLRRRSGRGCRRPVWPLIWAGHHRDPPTEHRPQRRPLLPAVVSADNVTWTDSLVFTKSLVQCSLY